MKLLILLFWLVAINVSNILGQSKLCKLHETCGKCLSADVTCSWCIDRDFDMRKPRCISEKDSRSMAQCKNIYKNTMTTVVETMKNEQLHDYEAGKFEAIQIQPQIVQMTLKKKQKKTIKMIYRPAKNYPLDLYYLMDMTWSMHDDKDTLVMVGKDLAETLKNLTDNYQLGFGSFVDKPSMPFTGMGKEADNPCAFVQGVCEKTYGFRHRLNITNDISQFVDKVNKTDMSANIDNLEGGLDALMQVLVCGEQIGWHNKSRKIVIFASDGLIHFAGDGLLAGVVKRNDKKCYLDENGFYTASLEFDYPSLEEIYHELFKRKVNIIFAVTQDVQIIYHQINSLLDGISSVAILKMDSSNILQLVKDGFDSFVKKAMFSDNAPPYVRIEYETQCGKKYSKLQPRSTCDNIEVGKEYEFLIHVTLDDYPEFNNITKTSIRIEEASIGSEYLQIDLNIEEECPCLIEEIGDMNSEICNLHGELKCGMCFCETGWAGKTCDCELSNYASSKELEEQCRMPLNEPNENETLQLGKICSDHGDCVCGQCECSLGLSGKYCECHSCPYYKEKECGGGHATCVCGTCVCDNGWSGLSCDCSTSTKQCLPPVDNGELCSGHGECNCNKCECDKGYTGAFCEQSATKQSTICKFYEPCVLCRINQRNGDLCDEKPNICQSNTTSIEYQIEFVENIDHLPISCMVRIESPTNGNVCEHNFAYTTVQNSDKIRLDIIDYKCGNIQLGAVVPFIVLATFLLGFLIIMVVKSYHVISDRREFAKFENERQNQTQYQMESPLYKSPNTRYEVPTELMNTNDFEMQTIQN